MVALVCADRRRCLSGLGVAMTVVLEGAIRRYIGLSTDEKPTLGFNNPDGTTITANDLPAGSSFMETDTGDIYRWLDDRWRLAAIDADDSLYVLQALLSEVTQLRQMVALAIRA